VAFASCREYPGLTPGDRQAADALRQRGIEVAAEVWDAPPRAGRPDLVVVRSCWDYHLRPLEFLAWIRGLESGGVDLANAPDALRWNLDKRYLVELAREGVAVAPTEWLAAGSDVRMSELLARRGWDRAVVKPSISASSYRTHATGPEPAPADEKALKGLLRDGDVLVQEYLPEIPRGEWSLIFLGGTLRFGVLKRAQAGDFRVQEEYGGTSEVAEVPREAARAAQELLDHCAQRAPALADLLYARVDGVVRDGGFVLTELELIEPHLFLELVPGAPERFADAISARLSRGARSTTPGA
jgi:glutathione synthase/RimK-type ligase-like ATP-grasp enzyme